MVLNVNSNTSLNLVFLVHLYVIYEENHKATGDLNCLTDFGYCMKWKYSTAISFSSHKISTEVRFFWHPTLSSPLRQNENTHQLQTMQKLWMASTNNGLHIAIYRLVTLEYITFTKF